MQHNTLAYDPVFVKLRGLWTDTIPLSPLADEVYQEMCGSAVDQLFRLVELTSSCVSVAGSEGVSLPPPPFGLDAYSGACCLILSLYLSLVPLLRMSSPSIDHAFPGPLPVS